MNETCRKVLHIFVMKNYAALVAKLQSRNLPLAFASRLFCSVSIAQYGSTRVKLGVTWHNFNMAMGQNATNVSLHGCIFAIKHFFNKSLEYQPLLHVFCCKKCSRSFKILQLQRLGINSQTLIAITLRLRARVNYSYARLIKPGTWYMVSLGTRPFATRKGLATRVYTSCQL